MRIKKTRKPKKKPSQHLEIQQSGTKYYRIIRTTFRENGETRHTTHGTITDRTLENLELIQAAFRGDVVIKGSPDAHKVSKSKEYGVSYTVLQLAKQLQLDRAIYSRPSGSSLTKARCNTEGISQKNIFRKVYWCYTI